MEKFSIEQITEKFAVCEKSDFSTVDIPLSDIPFKIKVGNILVLHDDGSYGLDAEEETNRREKIFSLMEKLQNKKKQ